MVIKGSFNGVSNLLTEPINILNSGALVFWPKD